MNKNLLIIFMFFFLVSNILALRINEVEINPYGKDTGNEWVELYSKEEVNLGGYKLMNNDGDEINLNGSFSGYYVYTFTKQWLDNSDEKIFLYKGEELIDETEIFEDNQNNELTLQLCDSWEFLESTKEDKNDCKKKEENEEENYDEIGEINNKIIQDFEETGKVIEENISVNVIKLNSKNIKSEENSEKLGKSNYAMYGFIGMSILIGVLFMLRKNKDKNEFE